MKETSQDYGYEFTISLVEAIEKWTKREERKNPDIFVYKGANLRFALERALYPRYSQNPELIELFGKYKQQGNIQMITSDYFKKIFLLLMCPNLEEKNILIKRQTLKKLLKKNIARGIRPIKRILSRVRTHNNYSQFQDMNVDTLLCANSPRFVQYIKTIMEKLPSIHYFSIGESMRSFFMINKLSFLNSSMFGRSISGFSNPYSYLESFGLTEMYDLMYETLTTAKPKVVVTIEGCAAIDEVTNQACKRLSIPCICIQQGWNNLAENGARNMTFSKMLVWGKGFTELLQPYNPQQKFIVTGNHIIKSFSSSKNACNKIKTISFFAQGTSQVLTKRKINDFVELIISTAKTFPNLQVIVREHPNFIGIVNREKIKKITNIQFMNPDEYSLSDVLEKSDLSVTIYSTTILESISMDVVPLIVNMTGQPNYWPNIEAEHAGIEVRTTEQAEKTLASFANGVLHPSQFYDAMMQFRKKYFSASGEKAAENIVREILSIT